MFEGTPFNYDISSWNVSKVGNMNSMFKNATAFKQNISGWSVSNVTNISNMFSGQPNLIETLAIGIYPVFQIRVIAIMVLTLIKCLNYFTLPVNIILMLILWILLIRQSLEML